MQRPILNPEFTGQMDESSSFARPTITRIAWATISSAAQLLIKERRQRSGRMRCSDSAMRRIIRAVLYRMAFLPILIALLSATLVYIATHPIVPGSSRDPLSQGIYFDPVSFASGDGTRLDGWLVPVLNAARVLAERDAILTQRRPAIVLVPESGAPREQMLPIVSTLHDAGFILLVINPRAAEMSDRVGCTFGLNEALDVASAVHMLRRRTFVDVGRVGVLGIGSGANAALLASEKDSTLNTLVLIDPAVSADEIIARHVAPRQSWMAWIRPICKWTMEIAYQVDLDDLDLHRFDQKIQSCDVLRLSVADLQRVSGRSRISAFLAGRLDPQAKSGTHPRRDAE